MKKRLAYGIFALIGLGSIAALGGSPQFVGRLIESIRNSAFRIATSASASRRYNTSGVKRAEYTSTEAVSSFLQTDENVNLKSIEIPEEILWRVIFGSSERFKTAAEKARAVGQDASLFTEYFMRHAKLSVENAQIFIQKAAEHAAALSPVTERMQSIGNYRRAARESGKKLPNKEIYALNKELLELQGKRKEITLKYRDDFRNAVDADSFANFENWLKTEFAAKFSSKKITSKDIPSKNPPDSNLPNNGFESIEKIQKEDNQK